MRASTWYAAVAVLYEQALVQLVGVVVVEVMHHTVAELRRENLPLLWALNYKTA
jgi:hypothetical protein